MKQSISKVQQALRDFEDAQMAESEAYEALRTTEKALQAVQAELQRLLVDNPQAVSEELLTRQKLLETQLPALQRKLAQHTQAKTAAEKRYHNFQRRATDLREQLTALRHRQQTYFPQEATKLQNQLNALATAQRQEQATIQQLERQLQELIGE